MIFFNLNNLMKYSQINIIFCIIILLLCLYIIYLIIKYLYRINNFNSCCLDKDNNSETIFQSNYLKFNDNYEN